jgi:hypothetical protein
MMRSKTLLLVSSLAYTIPFVVGFTASFLIPFDTISDDSLLAIDTWMGWLGMIGAWVGLITLVLALVNWKKDAVRAEM